MNQTATTTTTYLDDSPIAILSRMSEEKRREFYSSLTAEEAENLIEMPEFWLRSNQRPPEGDSWTTWLTLAGRGAGKNYAGACWLTAKAKAGYTDMAIIGQSKADTRDNMVQYGESSLMKIPGAKNFLPKFEPSKRKVTWPNGSMATTFSGDEPDSLRGYSISAAWVDELAKFQYATECWDMLSLALRAGPCPQVCVTTTPKPLTILQRLVRQDDVIVYQYPTWCNLRNLPEAFVRNIKDAYEGTALYRQEVEAELFSELPNSLFKRADLEDHIVMELPPLVESVTVLDPSGSATGKGDLAGIVVCALGEDGHGYILADRSGQYTPNEWAAAGIQAYFDYDCSCIVYESNFAGAITATTLQTLNPDVKCEPSVATGSKSARAQSLIARSEQGRIHPVGTKLTALIDEFCTFEEGCGWSPARLDACVHGFKYLFRRSKPIDLVDFGDVVAMSRPSLWRDFGSDSDLVRRQWRRF